MDDHEIRQMNYLDEFLLGYEDEPSWLLVDENDDVLWYADPVGEDEEDG